MLGQGAGPALRTRRLSQGTRPCPQEKGQAPRSLEGPQRGSDSLFVVSAPPGSHAQAGLAAAGGALPAEPREGPSPLPQSEDCS